jgi:PilZ domain
MTVSMVNRDRRRTPRTKLERLAYIDLESDNGGIVLNVSNGGLCFQSVAPVQPGELVRFWLSAKGDRIEAAGQLAWMDEKRKTVGVQFSAVSAEAHRQVHNWISTIDDAVRDRERKPAAPQVSASDACASSNPSTNAAVSRAPQNVLSQWLETAIRWAFTQTRSARPVNVHRPSGYPPSGSTPNTVKLRRRFLG